MSGKKYPIMIEYHGGGFTGGQATHQVSREVQAYIDNGFFFASMNYRLVATKYFYKHQGQEFEEEFLHVNSTGHIWPDSSGKFITYMNTWCHILRLLLQSTSTHASFLVSSF